MEGGHSHTSSTTIILGRPFLNTARTNIDVLAGKLTMEFDDRLVQFSIPDAIKQRVPNFIFFINTLTSFGNDDLFEDFDFSELSTVDNTFICDSCEK